MSQPAWAEELPTVVLPSSSDRIYPPERAPSAIDPVPRYGDDVWPLRFFSENPSMQNVHIHWRTFPPRYLEHFRLVVWALLNVPVPDELLAERAAPMVSTLSALRIYHNAIDYRMLGRWLDQRGVDRVNDLTTTLMADYADNLRTQRRVARGTAVNHLIAITRLWMIGCQIPQLRLAGIPPWVTGPIDDYLPAATRTSGENETEPIATKTISALLTAATRFIETGAEGILQAVELDRAVAAATRVSASRQRGDGAARLRAYLRDLRAADAPLPVKTHAGKQAVDNTYISYVTGASMSSVYYWSSTSEVREYAATHGAPTTVELGHSDLLPGGVPLTDVPTYAHLLQAACFTVITYLTGMRSGEALALEAGSLRPSSHSGGWMLLHSRTFKTARDEDGNHDSGGQIRAAPWVAVAPVIKAIHTLERLVGGSGLLFPADRRIKSAGRSIGLTTISDGVNRFIEHVNAMKPDTIPDDPAGRVTPLRFRRTLAWHIANQPGGLVALAVQYGHLRTAISEGYASRVRNGMQDMVDYETARAIAIRLSEAAEAMDNGEGVSGPASLRFVDALREQTERFNGIVTSPRQARSLLNNRRLAVFQNHDAFVWCNFSRDTALCLRDNQGDGNTPRLDRCKPDCLNVARTDRQAQGLRDAADQFRREAAVMPRPSAERLLVRANDLEARAGQHDRDRRTLGDLNATA